MFGLPVTIVVGDPTAGTDKVVAAARRLLEIKGVHAIVGLLYVDEPKGRGLAGAFEATWNGPIKVVSIDGGQTVFLTALRESARTGAQALVVIAFESATLT